MTGQDEAPDDVLDEFGFAEEREPAPEITPEPAPESAPPTVDVPASVLRPTNPLYDPNSLGSGVKWDTPAPAVGISMSVSFVTTATWTGSLFGKPTL